LKLAWFEAGQLQTVTVWKAPEALDSVAAHADAQGRIHLVGELKEQWLYLRMDAP